MAKSSKQTALAEKRAAKNMTQRDLAKAAGTTFQHISYLEREGHNPSLRVARRVARALGCTVDDAFPSEKLS